MLDHITPVILTYNEAPNLDRTLQQLTWAKRIVLVDSYSNDATLQIAATYPQVEIFQRQFDTHAQQWNYGIAQAQTDWVLTLDADYCVTEALRLELSALSPDSELNSYWIPFKFCVFGQPLRGAILPPREALFRPSQATYIDDGHTQLLQSQGPSGHLQSPMHHDDRKTLDRWLWAQVRYADLEVDKLLKTPTAELGLNDRIRQLKVVAPFAVLVYCLILRGGIFDGLPGWFYAFQRMMAETILAARLIETSWQQRQSQKSPTTTSTPLPTTLAVSETTQ